MCVDGICLGHVSEFKYLGYVLDESGTDEADCSRKVVSERRVVSAIRSLVNARSLQPVYARGLRKSLLVPVLTYGSETMIWREKVRSRIRVVQMDNLTGLLGIRRMDKVPNAQIWQLCLVRKSVNEKIDEGVLQWFGHVERIAKRIYVGECAGIHSVGRPWKRWIDTIKECLKKKGFDVRQARRMVHNRSVWRGFAPT